MYRQSKRWCLTTGFKSAALLVCIGFHALAHANQAPVCASAGSDPDGDGWGWENSQSCIVQDGVSAAVNGSDPVCQSRNSDSDGDGWGWENGVSCLVVSGAGGIGSSNDPVCQSAAADPDGDGWGWENGRSCIAPAAAGGQDSGDFSDPLCSTTGSDPDGDGWGWENGRSCRVTASTAGGTSTQPGDAPVCTDAAIDPDGDGWGWENNRSCRLDLSIAAAVPGTDSSGPVCSSSDADPDGDGWGWENGRSCEVRHFKPVSSSGNGERCVAIANLDAAGQSGVATFDLGELWRGERDASGSDTAGWNSVRNLSAKLNLPSLGRNRQLEIRLAGTARNVSSAGSQLIELTFGDQLLRNYSIATLAISHRDGSNIDIRSWPRDSLQLCGDFFDDQSYRAREPVQSQVARASVGAGVNIPGGEYACAQGWGVSHHTANGVSNRELVDMLRSWNVKSARVPMNEHCWLAGLVSLGSDDADGNGLFDYIERNNSRHQTWIDRLHEASADPEIASVCNGNRCTTQGENYRRSLIDLVQRMNNNGITVVLDLHWTGRRGQQAMQLQNLPNRDYSIDFWSTVASRPEFRNNSRVLFNLFNEPKGTQSWRLLRDGDQNIAGMQDLADAVRFSAGANNAISVGGLDFSGDTSGWLSYAVHDHLGKLWADNHAYPAGKKCRTDDCWDRNLGPIIAHGYGAMFGEAGNSIGADPQGCEQADFVKDVYSWAQRKGVPALTWSFIAGGVDKRNGTCAAESFNSPGIRSCQIPTALTRWPGQGIASLVSEEVDEKCSYDPTPWNFHDDATWSGCATLAYLHGVDMSRVADYDPRTNGYWGNCSAQEWYNPLWAN